VSIESWKASLQARGLSVNTIRSRLSAISILSGVKVQLPSKIAEDGLVMDEEQVRAVFRHVKDADRELMVSLLLTGRQPKAEAHWLAVRRLTTQEITRKLKRYARLAGLNEEQVNMRTWIRSGRELLGRHDARYIVEHILPKPSKPTVEWRPLHGIGRRRQMVKA
jgi:hypothetical protein